METSFGFEANHAFDCLAHTGRTTLYWGSLTLSRLTYAVLRCCSSSSILYKCDLPDYDSSQPGLKPGILRALCSALPALFLRRYKPFETLAARCGMVSLWGGLNKWILSQPEIFPARN